MNWFRKRDHSHLSVNNKYYRDDLGALPGKVAGKSMTYEDYDSLAVY